MYILEYSSRNANLPILDKVIFKTAKEAYQQACVNMYFELQNTYSFRYTGTMSIETADAILTLINNKKYKKAVLKSNKVGDNLTSWNITLISKRVTEPDSI